MQSLKLTLVIIGSIRLIFILRSFALFVNRQFMRKKLDLLSRYGGKGVWALVTGASDGIGAEFCDQLASDGFNICLVSRTRSKLEKVASDLERKHPAIRTKTLVADFSGNHNIQYYEKLMEQVKDIDVALLVLNAGIANDGRVEFNDS